MVQVGDLVEVSFQQNDPGWQVIELKEGRVNELLSGFLGQNQSEANAEAFDDEIAPTLGKHTLAQARRMQRQMTRLAEVEKIIRTDKDQDPGLNIPLVMTPDLIRTESYAEAIQRLVNRAREEGVAAASLPGGLHLVGLKRDEIREDYLGAVGHILLHLRHPGRPCKLAAGTEEGMERVSGDSGRSPLR